MLSSYNLEDFNQMRPLHFANGDEPPMLLLHGEDDTTVLPVNTRKFAARINEGGGSAETKFYPGAGHVAPLLAFARLPLGDSRIQADILVGNRAESDLLLLDVIPLSLGLETMGGLVEKIVPRNTTIPVARAQEFTTYKDGQTALAVHILQGERELVSDCRSLARFELRGIPPMVAGAARIKVTFQVDADGLLNVSAAEESTGVQAQVTVKPSFGLSDEEVAGMLSDSYSHAEQDKAARQLAEHRLSGWQLLDGLRAALDADGEALLEPAEQAQLESRMAELQALLEGEDMAAIRRLTEELGRESESFAARRMDRSIREALAGKSLDSLDNEVSE